jgi:hypothetical protein
MRLYEIDSENITSFMNEFMDNTTEHPMDRRARLLGHVTITLSPFDGEIHLSDISTYGDKNQGHGTKALKYLTSLAEKHNVTISGIAKAYSQNKDHIQSSSDLLSWYKKHGFDEVPDYYGSDDEGFAIHYNPTAKKSPNRIKLRGFNRVH